MFHYKNWPGLLEIQLRFLTEQNHPARSFRFWTKCCSEYCKIHRTRVKTCKRSSSSQSPCKISEFTGEESWIFATVWHKWDFVRKWSRFRLRNEFSPFDLSLFKYARITLCDVREVSLAKRLFSWLWSVLIVVLGVPLTTGNTLINLGTSFNTVFCLTNLAY